ncbi:Rpn14p [Saccharomyces paradoxus]|uniref:Rpn14p n=1 Tax=Saccharomyces paradoxus TaxID=27291 RepID=A0A8B8URP9_SACPA|nr:Rpn14 [Saccharomyces paradoxus]QHS73319.1 Rpn14 [Saccharomyces paradoxus]
MRKIITVAHIQYDFEAVLEEEHEYNDEFYVNVDKNLNEIKEHKIVVLANSKGVDAGEGNAFEKIDFHLYKARLDGHDFLFNTIKRDCSKVLKSADYTAVDTTEIQMRRFTLGTTEGDIKVLDSNFNLEREISQAHVGEITKLKFFPSGEALISSSQDMQLKIWSVRDGVNPRTLIGHKATVTDIAIIDRGRNVLSASLDGTIRLWECGTATTIHTFNRKENPYDGVNSIALFAETEKQFSDISTPKKDNLEFGTHGKHVIAGHVSGVITVYNVFSKEQTIQLPSKFTCSCNTLAVDMNNANYVYAGYENGMLAQWDLRSPECPVDEFLINEGTPITNVYFAAGALFVSSGLDTSIKLDIISDPKSERPVVGFETPTFLVSNDDEVSQFCHLPHNESRGEVIEVGKYNFCALYNLSNP